MPETNAIRQPDDWFARFPDDASKLALAVYVLYLVGLIFGVTGIIGLIIAYMRRDNAPGWLKSHCRFQIRTFWIGCLYAVITSISMMIVVSAFPISVLVGSLMGLFMFLWYVLRCIRGIGYLSRGEPHPDPTTWLAG